jgi:hypothetical protein
MRSFGLSPILALSCLLVATASCSSCAKDERSSTSKPTSSDTPASTGKPASSEPQVIGRIDAGGFSVGVLASAPADAQMLCSKCFKPKPMREMHVVPVYNAGLKKYVTGFRCADDWKATVEETRSRLSGTDSPVEHTSFMNVVERAAGADAVKKVTEGKTGKQASLAVIDAIDKGALVLNP